MDEYGMYSIEYFEELAQRAIDLPPLNNPQFPPSPYYRFLRLLAEEIEASLSVELGVSGGGGSLHLALGNPKGDVYGIDIAPIQQENHRTIKSMVSNFEMFFLDSVEGAKFIDIEVGPIEVDILFIDTIHTYERTWQEYEAWKPYLSDKAVVCFDDLFRPDMEGFWESLPEPKARLDKLHDGAEFGGGFGVIWQNK